MQLERFTLKAQEALAAAQKLAVERGHAQVEPEHLAVALLDQDGGLTVPILERIGASHDAIRAELDQRLQHFATVHGDTHLHQAPAELRGGRPKDNREALPVTARGGPGPSASRPGAHPGSSTPPRRRARSARDAR